MVELHILYIADNGMYMYSVFVCFSDLNSISNSNSTDINNQASKKD